MFSIALKITNSINLTGLDALDMRRILKLPDGIRLKTSFADNAESRRVPVSEGFARLHFPPQRIIQSREISARLLSAGDVVALTDELHADCLRFAPDISDQRIVELWLAAQK